MKKTLNEMQMVKGKMINENIVTGGEWARRELVVFG